MEYLVICLVAMLASGLTLFSGFGLGTLLMPAFALFFPVEVSVALTAVVHLLNNLFKLALLGRYSNLKVVLQFGLPSILAALLGAYLLLQLSGWQPLYTYQLGGSYYAVTPVKLVIALLLAFFAFFEMLPRFTNLAFHPKYLPLGGLLSGFFGGLSGNQGALRSAFLIRAGLSKEAFIATGVVIACLIDFSRLAVYARQFPDLRQSGYFPLLVAATLAAFAGAFLGSRLLTKVTMRTVQLLVAVMLLLIAFGLGTGLL